MQLEVTEDQELLRDTTERFIEAEMPVETVRSLHDDPAGFRRDWWEKCAGLGWFAMLVPEEHGGGSVSGAGLIDAAMIAEELGRRVQPGPFIPVNVVASAVAELGTAEQKDELLPSLAGGETVAAWAFASLDGGWDAGAGLSAIRTGEGFRLTGSRGYVQDAQSADLLLVAAELDGAPAQFLVPADAAGVRQRPLTCLDLSRRMSHLEFEYVTLPAGALLGEAGATTALERQLQVAVVLNTAETIGAMDALFSMTVQYAKDRIAFGRPIGSFQALKHIMADQAMYLETSKAGAAAAARAVQDGTADAAEVVSMVAAYIGDMSDELAQMALQIHGGIGYTWEHDLHLFMRRIRGNAALYGEPTWHRERVCAFHRLGERGQA
jgi:alkylation response protein AidB-like acyl-CoA dehydrogenase